MITEHEQIKKSGACSYSRIQKYRTCPTQYSFYMDGRKTPTSIIAETGMLLHKFAEQYAIHCRRNGMSTDLDEGREIMAAMGFGLPDAQRRDFLGLAAKFLEAHSVDQEEMNEVNVCLDVEFKPVPWDSEEGYIRGVLDKIRVLNGGRTIEITDYKSGWKIMPESELESGIQLPLYAFLASKLFPDAEDFVLCFDFVRYNYAPAIAISREDTRRMITHIHDAVLAIGHAETFPAKVGEHCAGCDYTGVCVDFQAAARDTGIHTVSTDEEARALAEMWMLQAIAAKQNAKLLKAWVEKNGQVTAGGGTRVGFNVSEKAVLKDGYAVLNALEDLKIPSMDISKIINVSKKAVVKLVKAYGCQAAEVEEFVSSHYITKKETRFGIVKGREEGE